MNSFSTRTLSVALAILLFTTAVLGPGCSPGKSGSTSGSYSALPNDGHIHEYVHQLSDDTYVCQLCGYVFEGDPSRLREGTPEMDNTIHEYNNANFSQQSASTNSNTREFQPVDTQWPTTNQTLLAIPEEQRWYNGWAVAGTDCTLVGPVVNVYQAQDEMGAPIFINIGEPYPSANGITLLVWADQYYDFAEMIDAVDDGGAWLSVSGHLSVYNGHLQFDAGEGPVRYQWWA